MTDLRHLQLVILDIIKDIDQICKKHGIEYYLLGGSALGAIRHKGFIPWDDDLDIIMDHRHYEKFMRVCREVLDPEKYYIEVIMQEKLNLYLEYVNNHSFWGDIGLIFKTFFVILSER